MRDKTDPTTVAGRDRPGERRIVTILFCDVAGSTSLAEHMDPEEWTDLMGEVFDRVIQPVYEFGGTVARLQGDAILALFGAPIAHEDDPERAILAGLAMLERVRPLAARLHAEEGLDLRLRVGINTGLAVVGQVGSELKSEYTAMGDAVNLAARMEQTAAPGTVQVSETTWKLSGRRFDFEDLGPIDVKGKDEPVQAYRVVGRLDDIATSPGAADAPLVGRREEVESIRHLLDSLQTGAGQILVVTGEAGIGKSRLVEELRREWGERFPKGRWIGSRAVSYLAHEPHLQTRNLVTALTSSAIDPRHILEDTELTAIGDLLSPGEDGSEENEDLPRILAQATEKLLASAATTGPVAVIVEDLHWSDESSSRLLTEVLSVSDLVPVLFVLTLRPDRSSSGWTLRNRAADDMPHRFVELRLEPLDPTESLDLVARLVDPTTVPHTVVEEIIRRSDGNPLFVEEIIRAWNERLSDDGPPSDGFTVPDSIQALLLSRLDRLEIPVRETVQIASVIGRTFPESVLVRIRNTEAKEHLTTLQRLDIVRESTRIPDIEFAFRHALTHETVYSSILRRSRRTFHGQVADALIEELADDVRSHAAALAHHLDQAGDPRTLKYARIAADQAFRLSAHAEAAVQYGIALRWALETEVYGELPHLVGRLGRSLEIAARYGEALDVYANALDVADRTGDAELRLVGLLAIARLRAYPNPTHDLQDARSKALEALELTRSLGDRRSEAVGLNILMMTSTFSGDPGQGIEHGEAALQLARDLGGEDEIAHTLNDLAWLYLTAGEPDLALESGAEAETLWRQLDNRPMLADSMAAQLYVALLACDFDTTERRAAELLAVARNPNNDWSLSMHSMIDSWRQDAIGLHSSARQLRLAGIDHAERAGNLTGVVALVCDEALYNLDMGRSEVAMDLAQRCIERVEERGFTGWRAWPRSVLVRAHLSRGTWTSLQPAQKLELLGGADEVRPLFGPGVIAAGLGSIEAAIVDGDPDIAEAGIERIDRYQREHNVRMWRPDLHLMRARVAAGREDRSRALELVDEVLSMIPQFGSSRLRWVALTRGAVICARLQDLDGAERFRREAMAAVEELALELPEAWRAGFREFAAKQVTASDPGR